MAAPRIVPAHEVLHTEPALLDGLDLDEILAGDIVRSAFVVVQSGDFAGRWFERGELVVCGPEGCLGEAVVLVAHTRGRPRLGHRRGLGFSGDRGEPCSGDRWASAGAVAAVWRRSESLAWTVDASPALRVEAVDRTELSVLRARPVAPRTTPRVAWWGDRPGEGPGRSGGLDRAAELQAADQLSLFSGGSRAARAA